MMNPFGPRGPSPYGMGGPSPFGGQGQMSLGSLGQGPAANMGWLHTLWGARQPQAPASTLPGAATFAARSPAKTQACSRCAASS